MTIRLLCACLCALLFFVPVDRAQALPTTLGGSTAAQNALGAVYPSVLAANPNCGGCHTTPDFGGPRNSFGLALATQIGSATSATSTQLEAWIRAAGQTGFEPRATTLRNTSNTAVTTLKISANRSVEIDTDASAGLTVAGAGSSFSTASLSPTTSLVSVQTDGDLTIGTLTEGASATFRIVMRNAAGFGNNTTSPAQLTVSVNNVPDFSGSAPAQAATDDNQTQFLSSDLRSSFSDLDSDGLSGVPGSVTVTEIRTETNTIDNGSYTLSPNITAAGVLSFIPTGFDALGVGESRTVTFSFDVTDGLDSATGTVSVLVNGVTETGSNTDPTLTARTLSVGVGAIPASTDLTQNDGGASFTDPDGDVLSITGILPDLSATPQFALVGNSFQINDAGPFDRLAQGQSENTDFTYTVTQTRPGTGGAETYVSTNSLRVTVTGVNDAPTANNFASTLDEGISTVFINLENETLWSDPDQGDTLTATNLQLVSQSAALVDDGSLSLENGGLFLSITPNFVDDLDKDEIATVVVTFDVTDTLGATQQVTGTLTIVGQAVSHATQAGLYANSLADLYPLSGFQQATSQPAACFTCHTTETNLLAAKPNCNAASAFTPYGRDLCNDDRGGPFGPRLERREAAYSPRIVEQNVKRFLSADDQPGYTDDTPILTTPGQTVDGDPSSVQSFFILDDINGTFDITASGQVRLLKNVTAGTYELDVYPINIAGSKDASGNIRNVPGFYPQASGLTRIVLEVSDSVPIAVDDTLNIEGGRSTTLDVLANDRGNPRVSLSATQPANGSVTVSGREIVYTPNAGFTGNDNFTYTSSSTDPIASSTATVSLTVVSPGAVLAADDFVGVVAGQTVTVDVLANDANVLGNTIVSINAPPAAGLGTATVVGKTIQFEASSTLNGDVVIGYTAQNPDIAGLNFSSARIVLTLSNFGSGVIAEQIDDPELKKVASSFDDSCVAAAALDATDETRAFLEQCANIVASAEAGADLTEILSALRNEENLASFDAVTTISRGVGRVIGNRLSTVRGGGGRGFDGSGLSFTAGGEQLPTDVLAAMAQSVLGVQSKGYVSKGAAQWDPLWGAFIAGEIAISEKDDEPGDPGFDVLATSLAAGIDYDLGGGRVIGLALGYSQSDTEFSNGSTLDAEGYQATVYGTRADFLRPGLTLDGYISLGQVRFTSDRVIRYTSGTSQVDAIASAKYGANFINISPRLSFRQELGRPGDTLADLRSGLALTWFGSLDYLHMKVDGYTETGGGGLALRTQDTEFDSLVLSLGVEASRPIYITPYADTTAYGSFSLNGELLDQARSLTSSFRAAGPNAPTFTVFQDDGRRVGGVLEFGTEFAFERGGNADFAIAHEFGSDNVRTTRLKLAYRTTLSGRDRLSFAVDADKAKLARRNWKAAVEYALDF